MLRSSTIASLFGFGMVMPAWNEDIPGPKSAPEVIGSFGEELAASKSVTAPGRGPCGLCCTCYVGGAPAGTSLSPRISFADSPYWFDGATFGVMVLLIFAAGF